MCLQRQQTPPTSERGCDGSPSGPACPRLWAFSRVICVTTVVWMRQRPHPKPDDRMPPPLNFQLERKKTFVRHPPRPGGTWEIARKTQRQLSDFKSFRGVAGPGRLDNKRNKAETRGQDSRAWGPKGARRPSDSARRGCTVAGARETLLARRPPVAGSPRPHRPF